MDAIASSASNVRGVMVLDRHADPVHNRLVLTFVGSAGAVAEAAFRCAARAGELIDLRRHSGVHPRIGATDVVPFVPLGATPMAVCVELARRVGRRIAAELGLPVYLYGEAAARPERRRLPDIRGGGFEELSGRIAEPGYAPDFGPARVGPAGATAVGARHFLVAYNVTLATADLAVARSVARAVRESSGGLPAVQARGFPTADPDIMQVSMNLLDTTRTPLHVAFARVAEEAARHGVPVVASELVGLVPAAVVAETTRHAVRLPVLSSSGIVESRLLEVALSALAPPAEP